MRTDGHFTADEAAEIGQRLGLDWKAFDVDQFRRGMDAELEHGLVVALTNVTDDDRQRIQALVNERTAAKKAKNYARADEIRKQLAAEGITMEDTAKGTLWRK